MGRHRTARKKAIGDLNTLREELRKATREEWTSYDGTSMPLHPMATVVKTALAYDAGGLQLASSSFVVHMQDRSPKQNASRLAAFIQNQDVDVTAWAALVCLTGNGTDDHQVVMFVMDGEVIWYDPNGDRTLLDDAFFDCLREALEASKASNLHLVLPSRSGIQSRIKRDVCSLLCLFAVMKVADEGRAGLDELMNAPAAKNTHRLALAEFARCMRDAMTSDAMKLKS